jgi:ketosteroid isomerase-like protein
MSQENVEIVSAAIDAYNRGDWETALSAAAPEFELDMSRSIGPQRGVYRLAEVRQFFSDWVSTFDSVRQDVEEFIEAGDDVAASSVMHVRGRDGVEAQARATWVFTFRDGMVVRMSMYQTKLDALEALGLRE